MIRLGPSVPVVANRCANAVACGDLVKAMAAVRDHPRFYIEGDVSWNGGTLGADGNPVTVVAGGNIELRGGVTAHGLFYSATVSATDNWDYQGSGGATIFGAFVSRGSFDNASGNMRLIYDPSLWSTAGEPNGRLVRVPGSWRDKRTEY